MASTLAPVRVADMKAAAPRADPVGAISPVSGSMATPSSGSTAASPEGAVVPAGGCARGMNGAYAGAVSG